MLKKMLADVALMVTLALWIGIVLMVCTMPVPVNAAEPLPNNFDLLRSLEKGTLACPGVNGSPSVVKLVNSLKSTSLQGERGDALRKEHQKLVDTCSYYIVLKKLRTECPYVAGTSDAIAAVARLDEVAYGTPAWVELMKSVEVTTTSCLIEIKRHMHALEKRMQ